MQDNAEEVCLPPREKVQIRSLSAHHWSINPSINKNLYSAPSRSLLRSASEPGQAVKSLQNLVLLSTGTVWEVSQI